MTDFQFKTTPWPHQKKIFDDTWAEKYFGLLMEQRTGKTKLVIDTAAQLFLSGRIRVMVVVAPNDVHREWVELQLAEHCAVPYNGIWWGPKVAQWVSFITVKPNDEKLTVLTVNYEALASKVKVPVLRKGVPTNRKKNIALYDYLSELMVDHKTLLVADESHRIKTPPSQSRSTKLMLAMAPYAAYRRILTGTPYGNEPVDLFPQFKFLSPAIFGIKTATAFKAKYTVMAEQDDWEYQVVQAKTNKKFINVYKTDEHGHPIWRNRHDLERRISPYCVRVKRDDCKEMPEKLYIPLEYEMSPQQRRFYTQAMQTIDKTMPRIARLNVAMACQQIMSNIVPKAYEGLIQLDGPNPRLQRLVEFLKDQEGQQVLIWGSFIQEIQDIAGALKKLNLGKVAVMYGETPQSERKEIKRDFMSGDIQYIVAHRKVGGVGQDFSAADAEVFYSNNHSLIDRLQAEDRAQHMMKENSTGYYDLVARNSVDSSIRKAVVNKEDIAEAILSSIEDWRTR